MFKRSEKYYEGTFQCNGILCVAMKLKKPMNEQQCRDWIRESLIECGAKARGKRLEDRVERTFQKNFHIAFDELNKFEKFVFNLRRKIQNKLHILKLSFT